jgi:hypothetical protein
MSHQSDACTECGAPLLAFAVPEDLREFAPGERAYAAVCTNCLTLNEASGAGGEPDFSRVSGAMPEGEAAVPMALALGLLDSLALHRREIEALLERVERAGTDPLLVIDRLATQGSVQAKADLPRRRHQLEQLME